MWTSPRLTRGGTQEWTEAGVTAHALGQGPSRPPASPPPGAVGGRGGLHTGAWRDGALASDLGTRRSRRTEGNGSETGGSETEEGRTPGVKPDARASSSERQKRPLFLGAGRLGWWRLPSEGKARGQANKCGQRKQRPEQRKLGKRGPRAQGASQRGAERHVGNGPQPSGATPSQMRAVLVQTHTSREKGKRSGLPQTASRYPADGITDQPPDHTPLPIEARAASR